MATRARPQTVRIIAGQWRGRRVPVLDSPGLRPSGDRVRETAFNWLGASLVGMRFLDLFAGSGILGLEALSRGASAGVFVEKDARVLEHLKKTTAQWPDIERARWVHTAADAWLHGPSEAFDLVFVDPPFESGLQTQVLADLVGHGWLAANARVYVESPANQPLNAKTLPVGLVLDREKVFGQVHACLLRYHKL